MKRVLVLFSAIMLIASCAIAQSELPKLMLKDIADQSKIVYGIEGGAVYKSGPEDSETYLEAWYDDFGYLDGYIFKYDCGCEIWYSGLGGIDVPNSNNQCGHTAPVKHAYKLNLLDEDLLKALKEMTGQMYTLEYLKTPVEMGELKWETDKRTFILEDKGYDDVTVRDGTIPCLTASKTEQNGKAYWTFTFNRSAELEDIVVVIKMDGKLSYYDYDGAPSSVQLGDYCEYYFDDNTFWVYAGYRYNSFADYDGNGKMYDYGYDKEEGTYYARVSYDMRNVLTYASFIDKIDREWFYATENGWLLYDEDRGKDVPATPDQTALASVLPPITKQEFKVSASTSMDEMKGTDVPFVLVDQAMKDGFEAAGIMLEVVAYPPQEKTIRFDLSLSDVYGEKIIGSDGMDLVLPWPYGLGLDWAKQHVFIVEHTTSSGKVEVFSTIDGTAQRADAGLKIRVTSFSPFVMKWGSEQEMQQLVNGYNGAVSALPSTGDNSSLLLWAGLLMASLCAYVAGRKARA